MLRGALLSAIAAVALTGPVFAQTSITSIETPHPVELNVKGTYRDPRARAANVRVQLLNDIGVTVMESYLDGNNNARFSVPPGTYRLRFSGIGIETQETPAFSLQLYTRMQSQTVLLTLIGERGASPSSSAGAVTAGEISVPKAARKEFDRGIAAMDKGDAAKAEKHFLKAIEIYPQYAMAYNNLGVLALRAGETQRGREALNRAVELGSVRAYVDLAKLAVTEKNFALAEELANKALTLEPRDPEALLLLANAQLRTGKTDQALASARRVHDLPHQDFEQAHLFLGSVLEQIGDDRGALQEYQTYLAEAPENPAGIRVQDAIAGIEARLRNKSVAASPR